MPLSQLQKTRLICFERHNHHHHHHHHIFVVELGHLLARSGLTCPEASLKVCLGSFCQSGSSVSLPLVIYYEEFCLNVSHFSCILIICSKFELFLTKHAGSEAKGSNPTTGLTLLWARNPFMGNFNHWQVSQIEASTVQATQLFTST
jgi:hypothetical protein